MSCKRNNGVRVTEEWAIKKLWSKIKGLEIENTVRVRLRSFYGMGIGMNCSGREVDKIIEDTEIRVIEMWK